MLEKYEESWKRYADGKKAFGNYVAVLAIAILAVAAYSAFVAQPSGSSSYDIRRFSSYAELEQFVKSSSESYGYYGGTARTGVVTEQMAAKTADVSGAEGGTTSAPSESSDYSSTNIQVEGVDEADIVKNDGKYIYTVSGNNLIIVDAYPAQNAKVISKIGFNGTIHEIFVNGDKLVVFGQKFENRPEPVPLKGSSEKMMVRPGIMPRYYSSRTVADIYDISDREKPVLVRNVSVDGSYYDSRMIGDYVYFITSQPVYYRQKEPIPLPVITSGGTASKVAVSDIYYFDIPDRSYAFTNIVSLNVKDDKEESRSKTFLTGTTQNVYVSADNLYLVYQKRVSEYNFYERMINEIILPAVPFDVKLKINQIKASNMTNYEKTQEIGRIFQEYIETLNPEEAANIMKSLDEKSEKIMADIAKEMEKSIVFKISVNDGEINYKTKGEVPGQVLNQFSMDEYNGHFRIATTTSGSGRTSSLNHLYVLDENLKIAGKLEDLAQGERIYSVRFLGDRAYMVTFRQTDPLFVIDLSSPENPKVLGYLKISGVSDYLHPYDATHVIGVGRDATEEGRTKGLKLALFDVADVASPKEISKYIIGERGTDSEALRDHKAFLFSREKNLLVLPVSEYSYTSVTGMPERWESKYWQGAYVFNMDLTNGIALKGKLTHSNITGAEKEKGYYYDYNSQIRRSLYIGNVLYTVSNKMIKMNGLGSLDEINKVELPVESEVPPYVGIME